VEEALVSILLKSAGLTALVSTRIHWGRAPQGAPAPYVVLQVISGGRDYTMQGASGYRLSRVQADSYSSTYTGAKKVSRAVTTALSGRRAGSIQSIFLDGERDLPAADAGEVTNLFRVSLDFMIHHSA
jgi:hypothetical protein